MSLGNVIGEILDGKYKIESQLGKGGMGTVYLATHIGTERPVALKVIASEFMKREEFVERFRREARAAGRLRHPNVVDVTDFGFSATKNGDVAYLVMEYLDGCTLGEILEEEKQLPVDWTVDILEQVCSAVHEAHLEGIIHRDLKPDNIWLEPNQRGGFTVKVLDFGIAKLEETNIITPDDVDSISLRTSNTQIIDQSDTVSDVNQTQTIADHKHSTVISESATVALDNPTKNIDTEAGTIIQSNELDSEGGTAIMPANQTQTIEPEEDSAAATKLISDKFDTDEENSKSETTGNSLISTHSTADLTRVGAVLGTPLYMSPEQCRGEMLTSQSDVYSMGVIVYQMLSGKTPFDGDYKKVMEDHKNQEPPPLDAKKVPKKLKGIVMQSLSKGVEDRPKTAESFASKIRANSEGIGTLLRRSLVIYSNNLPKFLFLTFLTFLPLIILTILKVGVGVAEAFEYIDVKILGLSPRMYLEGIHFFVSIITSAFLVGMMTWVVAQYLAFPLRPISLRSAFSEARKKAKSLTFNVGLSTIISFIGFAFCFVPGFLLSAKFMLIAPSIMMEDVKGKAAFKRSMELTKRSFRTVLATSLLVYVIPFIVGLAIATFITLANTSYVQSLRNNTMKEEISKMKKEGVAPQTESDSKDESDDFNIVVNNKKIEVETGETEKSESDKAIESKIKKFGAVSDGVSQFFLILSIIVLASFTSVITALLYFKTRQAGGETMQDLLGQLGGTDRPTSNWQKRVQKKILESTKITGNRKIVSGSQSSK